MDKLPDVVSGADGCELVLPAAGETSMRLRMRRECGLKLTLEVQCEPQLLEILQEWERGKAATALALGGLEQTGGLGLKVGNRGRLEPVLPRRPEPVDGRSYSVKSFSLTTGKRAAETKMPMPAPTALDRCLPISSREAVALLGDWVDEFTAQHCLACAWQEFLQGKLAERKAHANGDE